MAITRIKNNQITDASAGNIYLGVNAAAKLQDYSITSAKIANDLTYNSSLVITGNLTVQGNTTTIDTTNLVVEDPLIILASEQTGSPALDIGYIGQRGTEDNIAFIWDESADEFATVFTTDLVTNTTITINSYASLHTLNLDVDGNIDIGGNITITGNIAGNLNITGNLAAGNISAVSAIDAGTTITAVGNIDGGNLTTANQVVATGNVTGGNINTAGEVVATGNVTGGNLNTAGQAVVTGNVTGGNINTAGQVIATGNVTGGNLNTAGEVVATGNVNGGNLVSAADVTTITVTASGNIVGANINTAGQVVATGNITGGNIAAVSAISAGTTIDAVGNITGGNLITAGLTSTNTLSATGNANVGNLGTTGLITATGNISGGNLISNAAISAATTIDAVGNITGGNIITAGLTSTNTLSATGNANVGNLGTAGLIVATGNIDGGNINTIGDVTATGNVNGANVNTNSIVGTNIVITATSVDMDLTGNLSMSGRFINDLGTPSQSTDAATKQYVDDAVSSGIHIHTPVDVETPTALPAATYAQGGNTATVTDTIAGNTVVFSTAISPQVNDQLWFTNSFQGIIGNISYFVVSAPNTSAAVLSTQYNGVPVSNITSASGLTESVRINSGVGATLTANTNGALTVDGFSVSAGNRVLVYNQSTQYENGVYSVTDAGNVSAPWILTRSTDADTYIPDSNDGIDQGSYFYVKYGDTGAGESYVMTAPVGPFVIGLGNIEFTQFSASQVYSANTQAGLVLNGTVFSAKVDNDTTAFDGGGNIIVKAGANLVTPNIGNAVGNSLNVTGNIDAGNLISSGAVIGNVEISGNLEVANLTVLDLFTGNNVSISNTISATGNITGGNLISNSAISAGTTITATGNVTGGNINTAGQAVVTGNVTGGNINTAGQVVATGNVNGGNLVSAADVTTVTVTASGNIVGANVNATSGITAGTTVIAIGNVSGGNLTTTGEVAATGNITGGNLSAGSGTIVTTGNINGGNINATANVTGTGAVFSGNVTADNFIGNIQGNIDAGGANTNIQFNDDDILNGSAAFTFDKTSNLVTASGNISAGNLITGGVVSATGNVLGNNLILSTGIIDGSGSSITINGSNADIDFAVNGDTTANIFYIDAGTETASFGSATQTTNALVAFNSSTSILVPVGNSAQRPSVGVTGMVRFNTTLDALEFYDADSWVSAGSVFTVIDSEVFNGDGSTVVFTLGSDQTTDSCIVSINGILQIPVTSYSVSGNVLTFTEAPLSQDVIEVREITTTVTVKAISNTPGNAIIEVSDTSNDITITGDIIPISNVTQDIGSLTNRFRDIYLAGNSIYLGNLILKNTTANTFAFFGPDGTTPGVLDSNNVDTTSIANGTANVRTFSADNTTTISAGGEANVITVAGTAVTFTKDILNGQANGVGNIGNSTGYFNTIFAKATSAQYADLAEMYEADAEYEPGTVLCFGGTREVTLCNQADCTRVAGVVSTNPSYLMNSGQAGDYVAAVALQGRVPCRVTGTIRKGDLIVSTGDGRGRANNEARVGTVIGKALADFEGADGVIEVVVGRV